MVYIILVTSLIYSIAVVTAYRMGLKDGYKVYKGEPVITPHIKHEAHPLTDEEISRMNIENYNGSVEGQERLNV